MQSFYWKNLVSTELYKWKKKFDDDAFYYMIITFSYKGTSRTIVGLKAVLVETATSIFPFEGS